MYISYLLSHRYLVKSIFRQIKNIVIYFIKTLHSRKFCQSVRIQATVLCKNEKFTATQIFSVKSLYKNVNLTELWPKNRCSIIPQFPVMQRSQKSQNFFVKSTTGSSNTDPGKVEAYSKAMWWKIFQFLVIFQ